MTSAEAIADVAERAGVAIEYADLGEWNGSELRAEYDPDGPVIRVNTRVLDELAGDERECFVVRAIAHELYHHLEARSDYAPAGSLRAREAAAQAFAERVLTMRTAR